MVGLAAVENPPAMATVVNAVISQVEAALSQSDIYRRAIASLQQVTSEAGLDGQILLKAVSLEAIRLTVAAMNSKPSNILAWLGPAIGPLAFEVGNDVFNAFTEDAPQDAYAFKLAANGTPKYFADIYELARLRLQRAGVAEIFGGQFCTVSDADRFFSYRRDGKTGRMGAMIWHE